MRQPRRYNTEAIVIRHINFGETDRLLTLYTPTYGKIRAIAKGVRRSRSKSSGHLDLFTRASVMIAQGRNLDIVTQATALEHFSQLRNDLTLVGYLHYTSELIDSFTPEHLPNAKIYALHLTTLRRLIGSTSPSLEIRAFEMMLLDLSGYRPELHHCLGCGQDIVPDLNRFSPSLGGVLCGGCQVHDPQASEISISALKLLRNLQTAPQRVLSLKSMDLRLNSEIESRLQEYITYRLEKRPKSVAIMQRMETRLAG